MPPSLDAREASNKRRHGVRKARARLGCSHHAGSCPPGHRSPLSPISPWRCGGPAAPTARPFTTGMRMLLRRTECRSVSQSHLLPVGVVGICPKISYGYQARLDPNVSGTSGEFGSPTRMCRGVLSWSCRRSAAVRTRRPFIALDLMREIRCRPTRSVGASMHRLEYASFLLARPGELLSVFVSEPIDRSIT